MNGSQPGTQKPHFVLHHAGGKFDNRPWRWQSSMELLPPETEFCQVSAPASVQEARDPSLVTSRRSDHGRPSQLRPCDCNMVKQALAGKALPGNKNRCSQPWRASDFGGPIMAKG